MVVTNKVDTFAQNLATSISNMETKQIKHLLNTEFKHVEMMAGFKKVLEKELELREASAST
jgi:hypothetical protein